MSFLCPADLYIGNDGVEQINSERFDEDTVFVKKHFGAMLHTFPVVVDTRRRGKRNRIHVHFAATREILKKFPR